jgi:glycosyltransferase involved in cell wall biosynthesis
LLVTGRVQAEGIGGSVREGTPGVSVVIPAYNAARYVGDAVRSVLAQEAPDVEIIVVDDGSTDDTAEAAARVASPVRVLRVANGGPGRARNVGVGASRAPLVAFLDADDRWLPGTLALRRRLLEAAPDAALVHGPTRYVDETGRAVPFDPLAHGTPAGGRGGRVLRALFWGNFVHTSTVLVRRSALDEVGGFDERREVIEDYDLWLRLAARRPFVFTPEPIAIYLWRPDSLGRTNVDRAYRGQIAPLEAALSRGGLARTALGREWLRRRRLALVHAHQADDLLRFRGDTGGAAAALARSLRLQPFAPRRAAIWAASQAGPWAVERARQVVRSLRGFRRPLEPRRP